MEVSGSFSGDELIPESCLESEWIDEDEVFAILKQWETRGSTSAKAGGNNTGHILLNQTFLGNDSNAGSSSNLPGIHQRSEIPSSEQQLSQYVTDYKKKQHLLDDIDSIATNEIRLLSPNGSCPRFVDTGTFTRPKKRMELLNSLSADNGPSASSHHELTSGGSPLLNVQIGGPVTPAALATSATGNRLLMQRSWLNDVSPPCSIMNSMEYSTNDKITNSLITSGDFSSVGCLLNASDDNVGSSIPSVGNASYNGYNLYSVIEDRQRLENLCLDDESTLTKDCNISRTDLNAIESVSGVSTMQNSYESGGRAGPMVGSSKSSFEEECSPTGGEEDSGKSIQNTTVLMATGPNHTFHLPPDVPDVDAESRTISGRTLLNGGGTYDARRPRNFNTYRKPRSSLNQTFEGLPQVDAEGSTFVAPPMNERTFDGQVPVIDKHTAMNSTFGIVGNEPVGGIGHETFVRNRTITNDDVRLMNVTHDRDDRPADVITPPPAIPYDRTFKRRPRNGTFTGGEMDIGERHVPPDAANGDISVEDCNSNGTFSMHHVGDSSMLVQSTPFHEPYTRVKVALGTPDLSPIGSKNVTRTSTSNVGGRNVVRRSRNLEQDLRSAAVEESPVIDGDIMVDLETDDFDVQIRRLPSADPAGTADISNFLDAEKRISLQHFEEFEKSILESEHSGIDFDEMLNSLTADVRRSDEAGDKLRQSLDNIKKRHSRINLEKQQQDEMKRRLHQQQQPPSLLEQQPDNKLTDSMNSKSMTSSSGSERLLNRRSRYNEDVQSTPSPQHQQQLGNGNGTVGEEALDPVPTASEVETYDRKNRDRFKTIRLGRRRDDALGAALPDVDQELGDPALCKPPGTIGPEEDTISSNSAFSRVDHNTLKTAQSALSHVNGGRLSSKTESPAHGDDDGVFKKPHEVHSQQPQHPSGLVRPGESRLRSTLSKPRYYGAGPGGGGIQRKDLSLPLGDKSSSADCLEQRGDDLYQQQPSEKPLQPTSRLATASKLGGGSGGLIGTGRYSQFGLPGRQVQLRQYQSNAPPTGTAPALKSPMGTKSKSYHSLTFAQANNSSGYGGSSGNLSKLHGTSALQLKLKHNSSNTELKSNTSKRSSLQQQAAANLRTSAGYQQGPGGTGATGAGMVGRASLPAVRSPAMQPGAARTGLYNSSTGAAMANQTVLNATTTLSGGVQMRTAGGMAKTSRLGLVRPSSGYFSYNTHRKHPDSDNESINSLSSSSASSRGSLYRVDSQSIANNVQPQPFMSATRTNSIEDVSGAPRAVGNGLLTKLNGTGAGMSVGTVTSYASMEQPLPRPSAGARPSGGLKQPTATSAGMKPSGLRPPSAIRPPTVRSGLPRPTSHIPR